MFAQTEKDLPFVLLLMIHVLSSAPRQVMLFSTSFYLILARSEGHFLQEQYYFGFFLMDFSPCRDFYSFK